jgi:predicted nucleotidyltransferase
MEFIRNATIEEMILHKLQSKLCEQDQEAKIIYLTYFGSRLYGTNRSNSDLDFKGLYFPSKRSLILNKKQQTISWGTKTTKNEGLKNSAEDIDAQIWPVHYWLELLRKGDTNAIDLLFSWTNAKQCCVMNDCTLNPILNVSEAWKYVDVKHTTGYINYAYHQAKKYGLKGSRLDTINTIINYLEYYRTFHADEFCGQNIDDVKMDWIWDKLRKDLSSEKKYDELHYEFIDKDVDSGIPQNIIRVCGKDYQSTIKIAEALSRLKSAYKRYGERAMQAMENEGVDWKAISHAIRCLNQTKELIETKCINYPLVNSEGLLDIKQGKIPWSVCEKMIIEEMDIVKKMQGEMPQHEYSIQKIHDELLENIYQT